MTDQATPAKVRLTDGLGPLPPHRKVTAFGRVWIEEDLLAYGRQERAAERALWQEMAAELERWRSAAQKAEDALTWAHGGEPLPTLEAEALGLLRTLLMA